MKFYNPSWFPARKLPATHDSPPPAVTLFNSARLPAVPFHADGWPGITDKNTIC